METVSLIDLFGIWVSIFLTLAIFSFLYDDNPIYKLAENLFLGISIEEDKNYVTNLSKLFTNAFQQAGENNMMIQDFQHMSRTMRVVNDWKWPRTHHVTSLFIGGNKRKMTSDAFANFKPNVAVDVDVRAIIYVPDKIVAGVCFP